MPRKQPAQQPIVIVDSGVGGLSLLKEIHALLPGETLICVADNAGFPYGTKTEAQLIARIETVLLDSIERFSPKLIVLGCNTASTVALPILRARFATPIVGVVPAIKPAAANSQSKVIALLATEGTVERRYTDQLIADFATDCEVIRVGSRALVELAEELLRGSQIDDTAVTTALQPLNEHPKRPSVDQLVLGCTHFPLLKPQLDACLPGVSLVDSGVAIAQRVRAVLRESDQLNDSLMAELHLYLTKNCTHQNNLSKTLANWLATPIVVGEFFTEMALPN